MNKGFTLMEVLVVVIILAVVSLISFPAVKSIIQKNRENTFRESVNGIIRSTELYISANAISEDFEYDYDYLNIEMEKYNMTGGKIVYSNGVISVQNLSDGEFCASGTKNELTVVKGEC